MGTIEKNAQSISCQVAGSSMLKRDTLYLFATLCECFAQHGPTQTIKVRFIIIERLIVDGTYLYSLQLLLFHIVISAFIL